jgi:hypothetical protein
MISDSIDAQVVLESGMLYAEKKPGDSPAFQA